MTEITEKELELIFLKRIKDFNDLVEKMHNYPIVFDHGNYDISMDLSKRRGWIEKLEESRIALYDIFRTIWGEDFEATSKQERAEEKEK